MIASPDDVNVTGYGYAQRRISTYLLHALRYGIRQREFGKGIRWVCDRFSGWFDAIITAACEIRVVGVSLAAR